MQLNPITLSRRLYCGLKTRRLRKLAASLAKQREAKEKALTEAARQAIVNAARHYSDPALQDRRRLLRADHQVICDRQAIVSRELMQLGVAS